MYCDAFIMLLLMSISVRGPQRGKGRPGRREAAGNGGWNAWGKGEWNSEARKHGKKLEKLKY